MNKNIAIDASVEVNDLLIELDSIQNTMEAKELPIKWHEITYRQDGVVKWAFDWDDKWNFCSDDLEELLCTAVLEGRKVINLANKADKLPVIEVVS